MAGMALHSNTRANCGSLAAGQVCVHTDEQDLAALFLYRKLSKEPILEPVLMAGPEVGASDEQMQARSPCLFRLLPLVHSIFLRILSLAKARTVQLH